MFKIFTGYALVEKYHNWKKSHKTDDKTISRIIRLLFAIVACLLVWCLPVENWIDGMTIIQKRTLAIFLFAILMWLFEAVPAWTTSVMVVVMLLFTTSNSSLTFFNNGIDPATLKAYTAMQPGAREILANRDSAENKAVINVLTNTATRDELKTALALIDNAGLKKNAKGEIVTVCDTLCIADSTVEVDKYVVAKVDNLLNAPKDTAGVAAKYYIVLVDSDSNKDRVLAKVKADSTLAGREILTFSSEIEEVLTPENVSRLTPAVVKDITAKNLETISPEVTKHGYTSFFKSLLACFADPIIMLFIGGFVLAIAASKTGLDLFLARVMLKPFGTNPKMVLLGFLMVTGVFSMFLSNTATAAMMLTFLGPVLKSLPADGKGKTALALAIPIAANIGGMGTPIGTPPNAIALKYMSEIGIEVGFGQWMAFMIPFTILLLFLAWLMLIKLFPFKAKEIKLNIEGELKKDWRSVVVYITFIATVLLWVLDKATGVNANVVAMLPVGVCAIIGVLTKRDLEEISWSVLWMVAGGFALGVALQETGLAQTLINAIPFAEWPPILMVVGSGLICYIMANFISHTATANLLVPILALVGASISTILAPLGGVSTLLIGVAIGSSLGMVLPISTPPNAIAAATGMIEQKDMVKTGLIMGILGLVIGYGMLIVLGSSGLI